MLSEIGRVIEQVSRDKGIEKGILISTLKEALQSAARKKLGPKAELDVRHNEDTGEIEIFQYKTVASNVTNPDMEISLKEALELDPENVDLRRELAYLHLAMGHKEEAERQFAKIVEQAPHQRPTVENSESAESDTEPSHLRVINRRARAGLRNAGKRVLRQMDRFKPSPLAGGEIWRHPPAEKQVNARIVRPDRKPGFQVLQNLRCSAGVQPYNPAVSALDPPQPFAEPPAVFQPDLAAVRRQHKNRLPALRFSVSASAAPEHHRDIGHQRNKNESDSCRKSVHPSTSLPQNAACHLASAPADGFWIRGVSEILTLLRMPRLSTPTRNFS